MVEFRECSLCEGRVALLAAVSLNGGDGLVVPVHIASHGDLDGGVVILMKNHQPRVEF